MVGPGADREAGGAWSSVRCCPWNVFSVVSFNAYVREVWPFKACCLTLEH